MSETVQAADPAAEATRSPEPGGGPSAASAAQPPGTTQRLARNSALHAFARHRMGVVGLGIIAALAVFCFLGPLVYHTDQVHASIQLTNLPPARGRPLGTDSNGYDILGRLMAGGQSTLEIGFAVAVLATIIGIAWGAVAGYAGGLADAVMMRVVDIGLAVPAIFLLIYLSSVFRPTIFLVILVLSLLS